MTDTHKQVIVMRTDLGMRKGKMCAQAAHASLKVLLDIAETRNLAEGVDMAGLQYMPFWLESQDYKCIPMTEAIKPWLEGRFTKICVGAGSEAELVELHEKAKAAGLLTSLIRDAGLTEFNGVPTLTCAAIGPDLNEKVDEITGKLKLL